MSSESPPHVPSKDQYYDLGSFSRPISTTSKDAQAWFDRGLIWSYAFNHEEAASCFQNAIAYDPNCAMAYWGLAYTLGPNYNKPWGVFDDHDMARSVTCTHLAASQAKALSATASPAERCIIDALQYRYPETWPAKDFEMWNEQYVQAMAVVYKNCPDDLDVAALFADAIMNLTPWQLWDLPTGTPAKGAGTLEAKFVLDRALATDKGLRHPGLLHLYIHLMEMSGTPEAALTIADHLRGLVPDSGHLNHMPTHLDVLCGDYRRAIASNSDAICADRKFLARKGPLNFYTLYRSHNYHFKIYAAMFSGQSKIAFDTVDELEASIPGDLLRIPSPPMADWLEGFISVRIHILIRFGRWQDLIDLPLRQDPILYSVTTAMTHYGKGVAYSATSQIALAEEQQTLFQEALKHVPHSRTIFNNKCLDILAIAESMLSGELLYRKGQHSLAFEALEKSIKLDDNLPYDEPWGWMQPTRHAYGALLLEQGEYEKAENVYAADLGFDDTLPRALRHSGNVWALHGYYECLQKLGREAEMRILEPMLKHAVAVADVPVKSSCFCRLEMET